MIQRTSEFVNNSLVIQKLSPTFFLLNLFINPHTGPQARRRLQAAPRKGNAQVGTEGFRGKGKVQG